MFGFQKTFHNTDDFSTLSPLFVRLGFPVCSSGCSFFYRSFDLRELNHSGNGKDVRVRYNSLLISLNGLKKQQHEIATFCVF